MKETMKKLLKYVWARAKEPSTLAALAALSVLFGVRPEVAHAVASGATVVVNAAVALGVNPADAVAVVVAAPSVALAGLAMAMPDKAERKSAENVEPVPTGPVE